MLAGRLVRLILQTSLNQGRSSYRFMMVILQGSSRWYIIALRRRNSSGRSAVADTVTDSVFKDENGYEPESGSGSVP